MRTSRFLTAIFALMLALTSFGAKKKATANTFQTPDFAYPVAVVKNADATMTKALKGNDWAAATRAIIQTVTAKNLISHDNVTAGIARVDSVAALAPEEWRPALLLIEADIYTSIYNDMGWQADQRQLPLDTYPENPYDWSKDLFAQKVNSLCSDILAYAEKDTRPLKLWDSILTDTADAIKMKMTVGEFLAQRSLSILNTFAGQTPDIIPFFTTTVTPTTPSQKSTALRNDALDLLISQAEQNSQPLLLSQALVDKANTLSFAMRRTFLLDALDKTKGTEGQQQILVQLESYGMNDTSSGMADADNPLTKEKYLAMLQASLKDFPSGRYAPAVMNIINEITQPSADIRFKSQYLTSDRIKVDATLSNTKETWLLVFDYAKYLNSKESVKNSTVAANCPLVKAVKVSVDGTVPFKASKEVNVGPLPVGNYVIIPSSTSKGSGIYSSVANQSWRDSFRVSDITVMMLKMKDGHTRIFVVNGNDADPIEGATVKIYSPGTYKTPEKLLATLTTNADGYVETEEKMFKVRASYKDSQWTNNETFRNSMTAESANLRHDAKILTDLAIYHPGDTVRAAVIGYQSLGADIRLTPGLKLKISLKDANRKEVSSQEVTLDSDSRATIAFPLPSNGLLGFWSLSTTLETGENIGSQSFQVADYVAPTFFITLDQPEADDQPVGRILPSVKLKQVRENASDFAAGDTIRISGQVLTYSGMPLQNATVNYSVRYNPGWRWGIMQYGAYESKVTTDAEGKFMIILPTANLKGTFYSCGVFNVSLSATSEAGETQQGPSTRFALGNDYIIHIQTPGKIEASNPEPIKVNVLNLLGENVKKGVKYTLTSAADSTVIAQGEFTSPTLELHYSDYPSARYRLEVEMTEYPDIKSMAEFTVWRESDTTAPAGTGLWVPQTSFTAEKGQKEVTVKVGDGNPLRWLAAMTCTPDSLLSFKWIRMDDTLSEIKVPVPDGKDMNRLYLYTIDDLDIQSQMVMVNSFENANPLKIKTETFRDKVSAGDQERWRFSISKQLMPQADVPAMAVMTDASLNAITPFSWYFHPYAGGRGWSPNLRSWYANDLSLSYNLSTFKYLSVKNPRTPAVNNYGQGYGLYGYTRGGMMEYAAEDGAVFYTAPVTNQMKAMDAVEVRATVAPTAMKMAMAESVEAETVEEAQDDADSLSGVMIRGTGNAGAAAEETPLRDSECPVAFFMADLKSDSDGMVDVDFTVPNFNTTWAFQLLAYDESLQTDVVQLKTVASKPVMVQTHAPRFVRTGDRITLTATLFNNSGKDAPIGGRIQLMDLIAAKPIASKDFPAETMKDGASRVISMEWDVPSGVSMVGFRAYADGDSHRDGEQALLPVLPASTPVVESTPFWLTPGQERFETKLPKFNTSDQVSLQYCDNPAWYCLTALPDITVPESKSILSKVRALYGNTVAYHLIASNENLRKGLETLLSDKDSEFAALKSNLEKDGNLKVTELNNTPWVNNAASETLRMSRLSSLLDEGKARDAVAGLMKEIKDLQTSEGGWSWCPDMEPSSWMTQNVLRHFSMMESTGALSPAYYSNSNDISLYDVNEMIRKGIGFIDTKIVEDYRKYHKKGDSLMYLLEWLYGRSAFASSMLPSGGVEKEFASIAAQAVKDIAAGWKDLSIDGKALAATLLWRSDKKKDAEAILESLRQYASTSPEKGVWFDNLTASYGSASKLPTTTHVLEALCEIKPGDPMIDGIRQWLVLCRQTQDWGQTIYTAETVDAILTSGTDWTTGPESAPQVWIGGKKVNLPESAKLTGAFTMTLGAKDASKAKLRIDRNGTSPAWGGIISQYVAPLSEVKAESVPDLSITKQVVALVENPDGSVTPTEGITLEKGMKVRVTLTVTADRDIDYVAITDGRSACLEPDQQLSGYAVSDGLWYYREVRDAATNIFIDRLPKGHHVISYDCHISQSGDFTTGVASAQSQYSPLTSAHSAPTPLTVK